MSLASRKVSGSEGYTTLLGGFCVNQPKMSDGVGGMYTFNTVKLIKLWRVSLVRDFPRYVLLSADCTCVLLAGETFAACA